MEGKTSQRTGAAATYTFSEEVQSLSDPVATVPTELLPADLNIQEILLKAAHGCLITELSIDDSLQTVTLQDCQLVAGRPYEAVVYVQDAMKDVFAGTLSDPLEVKVPEMALVQNTFIQYPKLITTPTSDGFNLTFTPEVQAGVSYVSVLLRAEAAAANPERIRGMYGALGNNNCRREAAHLFTDGITEAEALTTLAAGNTTDGQAEVMYGFSGCNLESGVEYGMYVLLVGVDGLISGAVLSSPLYFSVASSNTFTQAPMYERGNHSDHSYVRLYKRTHTHLVASRRVVETCLLVVCRGDVYSWEGGCRTRPYYSGVA